MHIWRKTILWLIIMWLPTQGFSTTFMPLDCQEHANIGLDTATSAPALHTHHGHEQGHAQHSNHAENIQPDQPADQPDKHCMNCNDCSICQMCVNLALPSELLNTLSQSPSSISQAVMLQIASFIPAQPQRPPRLILVI